MSDTIPKAEVARVLAEAWNDELGVRRGGARGGGTRSMKPWLFETVRYLAESMSIRPEFESAIAALEQKEKSC